MIRNYFPISFLAAAVGGVLASTCALQAQSVDWNNLKTGDYMPGELLIGYKPGIQAQSLQSLHVQTGADVEKTWSRLRIQHIKVGGGQSLSTVAGLYASSPQIAFVEPNYIYRPLLVPDDPRYSELYGLDRMDAEQAWDSTTGSTNFVVGVIDTGILRTHEDLKENMWVNPGEDLNGDGEITPDEENGIDDDGNGYVDDFYGWDFANDDNDPSDNNGHGTHVAGTIGAVGNNNKGVVGVNWEVKIVALKFLDPFGSTADAIDAVEYCRLTGIQLSNNSWGGGGFSTALETAIRTAGEDVNHLFVAAAGNDGMNNDSFMQYPASYALSNIVSVAAIDENGSLASFSNYGKETVDLGAAGVGILSTDIGAPENQAYGTKSGTSMASPHVAGAAALLWSINPALPNQDIKSALFQGVEPNPALAERTVTGGELNLLKSLGFISGAVQFDQDCYNPTGIVGITVSDYNETNAVTSVTLNLLSNAVTVATDTLALNRLGATSDFAGSYDLTLFTPPAQDGFVLEGVFTNSDGNTTTNQVPIDGTVPMLSLLSVLRSGDTDADIEWYTDEPADSRVILSTNVPPGGLSGGVEQGSLTLSTDLVSVGGSNLYRHVVTVTDLEAGRLYYFAVLSADCAGNEVTLPADLTSGTPTDYPRLITQLPKIVDTFGFETGPEGWTSSSLSGTNVWERGRPTYGPTSTPSGSNVWGTVLNGRYPNAAYASLTSPPVTVRENPQISFYTWHWFADSVFPFDPIDFGVVEVNDGSGWVNVTDKVDIFPSSQLRSEEAAWRLATVKLPDFANSNLRVRFRIETTERNREAGWYIDRVRFSDTAPAGLSLADVAVQDGGGGDGDGFAEPGETFFLDLRLFNSDVNTTFSNVVGNAEIPDAGINTSSSVVQLNYGDIAPGQYASTVSQLWVSVDAGVPLGTLATVFHEASADNSGSFIDDISFEIGIFETVTGVVTDRFSGVGIDEAIVEGVSDAGEIITAQTDSAGEFALHGARPGVDYSITARKPGVYSRSPASIEQAPAGGVNFGLGQAVLDASPTQLVYAVFFGSTEDQPLVLDNSTGTVELQYSLEVEYQGDETSWLELSETVGSVAPGLVSTVTVTAGRTDLPSGTYDALLRLQSNDVDEELQTVPVVLTVESGAILELLDVLPEGGDEDGFVEAGELLDLDLILGNSGNASAFDVVGPLMFIGNPADLTVVQPTNEWFSVTPGFRNEPFTSSTVQVAPGLSNGTELPFQITVTGEATKATSFDFALTVQERFSIRGMVTDTNGTGLADVEVLATGPVASRAVTDTNGTYSLNGLTNGLYTVLVEPPLPYSRPASQSAGVSGADVSGVDFVLSEWLVSTSPTSIVETVNEGEETNVLLTVENQGPVDGRIKFRVETKGAFPVDTIQPVSALPPVDWQALTPSNHVPNQLLVLFDETADTMDRVFALNAAGVQTERSLRGLPMQLVNAPNNLSLQATAQALEAHPSVLRAEPNYLYELFETPDDPLFNNMYGLLNTRQDGGTLGADINIESVWDEDVGSRDIKLAIIDSGIYTAHVDLVDNAYVNPGEIPGNNIDDDGNGFVDDVNGYDFANDNGNANPDPGSIFPVDGLDHGTHVAGTAGAVGDNTEGIVGVNWNVSMLSLKISRVELDPVFQIPFLVLPTDAIVEAIQYCIDNDIPISNNSYGGPLFSGLMYNVIQSAATNGHLMVCAAGNSGDDSDLYPQYPAAYNLPNIISVAASDRDGLLADFSNYGADSVDLAAPGVDILSTINLFEFFDTYEEKSGTSMASPHVAGAAALLQSLAPGVDDQILKQALLLGVRPDDNLSASTSSGGHLDVAASVDVLKNFWIDVQPEEADLASGSSTQVVVSLNQGARLLAGSYEANLIVEEDQNGVAVPVSLTVLPAPVPQIAAVHVMGGDGDAFAEVGETVTLAIELRNAGSALFLNPTGQLSTADGNISIVDAAGAWPSLLSGETGGSTNHFEITLSPGVSDPASFTLAVGNGTYGPILLDLSLPTADQLSITGQVRDAQSGSGLTNVTVEYWGDAAGRVVTDSNGFYRVDGLSNGTYRLRPVSETHEKPVGLTRVISGADVQADFDLRQPHADLLPEILSQVLVENQAETVGITLSNAAMDALDYSWIEFPHLQAALVSDGNQLSSLQSLLESFGMNVTVLSNNVTAVSLDDVEGIHTSDDALMYSFDLILANLEGPDGGGRLLSATEQSILEEAANRGATVLLTGESVFSRPDDERLVESAGVASSDRTGVQEDLARPASMLTNAQFAVLGTGDWVSVTREIYDTADLDTNVMSEALLTTDLANKWVTSSYSNGQLSVWNGNPEGTEWKEPGLSLDLLKTFILETFAQDVSWLSISPVSGSVSNSGIQPQVMFSSVGVEPDDYQAVLLLRGNVPGNDLSPLPVEFQVQRTTLDAQSSTGVMNWLSQPLSGNGGGSSSLLQLIYAGPDGQINGPNTDGSVGGDDELLNTFPGGKSFGRVGAGVLGAPDLGLFSVVFAHDFLQTTPVRDVYVRAWDGATFSDSVAYGDSGLYTLQVTVDEAHDFGTWTVGTSIGYPGPTAPDTNGDSIPDGWYIENGMDPRDPIAPLEPSLTVEGTAGTFGSGAGQFAFPNRTFRDGDLLFVLDRENNRIQVHHAETFALLSSFGTAGTSNGEFSQPLGLDGNGSVDELYVADSGNHRIQVLSYNPTGALTYQSQFGGTGTGAGQFNDPRDLAVGPAGNLYVADTDNHRIQILTANGVHIKSIGSFGSLTGRFNTPTGIGVDSVGIIYVADTFNHRIQGFSGGGGFLFAFGAQGSGDLQFEQPKDVEIGFDGRIVVSDTGNHRVQIFDSARNHLASLGVMGGMDGEFRFPAQFHPSLTNAQMIVADTWNHRVQVLTYILDADEDGMDDTWELLNGLDPSDPSDAILDTDSDDVLNIGEYRIDTDPQEGDTDGDGVDDGTELEYGTDVDDPMSAPFIITTLGSAPDYTVTWPAITGGVYKLQQRMILDGTNAWFDVPDSVVTSLMTGSLSYNLETNMTNNTGFFRTIRVED